MENKKEKRQGKPFKKDKSDKNKGRNLSNKKIKTKGSAEKTTRSDKKENAKFSNKEEKQKAGKKFSSRTEKSSSSSDFKKLRGSKNFSGKKTQPAKETEEIRLNKYLSNAGICSRRKADELITAGVIKINGRVVTELGTKVKPGDVVEYDGQVIKNERKVYILLNKPKDFITTMDDPEGRKTVMQLIKGACKERVYPVGRLDRMTTGLLLLTNDGELATELMHPRYKVRKVYAVELDQPLSNADYQAILKGVELEDGIAEVDYIAFTDESDKRKLGIEIHIGKNRIIRRIFEHLGYKVIKLDRVIYAGLTKKDLPRGRWRFLTQEEINRLKMKRFE